MNLQAWAIAVTIVNACISALVVLGATWLAHRFTRDRDNRKDQLAAENRKRDALRERLEALVESVFQQYEVQIQRNLYIGNVGVFSGTGKDAPGEPTETGLSAEARSEMLQSLYFPEFAVHLQQLGQHRQTINQFRSAELDLIAANLETWRAHSQPTFGTRSSASAAGFYTAAKALEAAARQKLAQELMPV